MNPENQPAQNIYQQCVDNGGKLGTSSCPDKIYSTYQAAKRNGVRKITSYISNFIAD